MAYTITREELNGSALQLPQYGWSCQCCDFSEIHEDSPPSWKQKVCVDSGEDKAGEEAKVNQELLLAWHQQISSLPGPPVGLSG